MAKVTFDEGIEGGAGAGHMDVQGGDFPAEGTA